jgi:hypothetical protein
MSLNDWAALIVSSITIIAALGAAIRYLVRNYLSELKPDGNGGHNLEGRVKRIEDKLDTLYTVLISRK